jgi:hypothetical protein
MKNIETHTIDRLFLELSQVTKATTGKELHCQQEIKRLTEAILEAPHGAYCSTQNKVNGRCDCWKSEALKSQ